MHQIKQLTLEDLKQLKGIKAEQRITDFILKTFDIVSRLEDMASYVGEYKNSKDLYYTPEVIHAWVTDILTWQGSTEVSDSVRKLVK